MQATRYRVSYPLRPDLPGDNGRGFSILQIERREDGWLDIRHIGGQAPPCGLLAGLLVELKLVRVLSTERAGLGLSLELELPERLRGAKVGYTCRRGSTGAMWGHAWEVDPDGFRIRMLSYWHESMYGRMNEPVGGYPEILFGYATRPDNAGDFIAAFRNGFARVREDRPVDIAEDLGDTIWASVWVPASERQEEETEQVSGSAPAAAMEPPPPPPPCEGN